MIKIKKAMKIRQLEPGKGTDFSFPVILKTEWPIVIQVEDKDKGLSFSFEVERFENGIRIRAKNGLRIEPYDRTAVIAYSFADDPEEVERLYPESDSEEEVATNKSLPNKPHQNWAKWDGKQRKQK